MDIKEKRKQYYQDNKERILEKAKQYSHDHKEERQRYNQKYWETNGHKYIEQRKTSVDHKAKYLEMKEYHKEYHQKHYQQYGKDYYMKNKNIIQDKYEQYHKDYYMNNKL